MEISILSDPISSITHSTHSLPFSNPLLKRPHKLLSLSDTAADQSPPPFHVSTASTPPTTTLTRRRPRSTRRIKRKTVVQEDGEKNRFSEFSGDGFFGGGGSGSGGWNFGGFGGSSWDGFSEDDTVYDPAFDFVYGVLCWIALSNCLLFSFKRVVRLFGDREKVPMEMTTVY